MANRRFIDFPIATTVGDSDIILIWQSGVNKQTTKATFLSGLPENLDELNDVAISGLTNGQILRYDSVTGKWENTDQGNLDLNDLNDVSIVSPSNGQVLVYNSSTSKWENSSGGFVPYTGAVTTVNLGAQTIQAGQFVKAGGTSSQFLKADGSIDSTAYGTGSVTSVGLTMPSAFSVANSPITSAGTLAVTGAGTVSQYIRGDGSLADFPEASGGGSSISYYLNGSVNQGTIGGVAYKELNKVPILGAGTDFSISADGYIASFLTDAGDPNLLEIPGGNWNFETYFSSSSSGGTPTFYVELYKYDGTTFTLIASNSGSPEFIAFGTTLTAYFSTLAVPTTTLALTDRLAVRYYVTHSGRTITLHTEDNNLCQIITTFTTGLTALNGLTAQVQNFSVGTSGTDFAISSATATHTFNLPTASATNRGALSSADWSTFNGKQNALTNPVTGTGTNNYLPKFTGLTTIGDSVIADNTNEVNISKRIFLNSGGQSIFFTPNLSGVSNRIEGSSGIPLEIFTGGSALRLGAGGSSTQINLASTGVVTMSNLAGTGSRIVVADSSGNLSASSALSGYVQGSGTTNYLPKFTGSTTIGNSTLQEVSGNLGLGVNPSSWSQFKALEIGTIGNGISGFIGASSTVMHTNAYWNGTNWIYANTANSAQIEIQGGNIIAFKQAASGTGGNVITYTQPITLFSGGNLLLSNGAISDNGSKLQVVGSATFSGDINPTSNNSSLVWSGSGNKVSLNAINGVLDVYTGTTSYIKALTIASTGAATFSSNQNATSTYTIQNTDTTNTSSRLRLDLISGNSALSIVSIHNDHNYIASVSGKDLYFQQTFGGTTNMAIKSNGNVLIGTTTDSGYKLDVFGDARFGDGNNFNPLIQFAGSGRVQTSPGYSFVGDLDTGMFNPNTGNTLAFATGGSERVRITSSGNVGIGTTSPGYKTVIQTANQTTGLLITTNANDSETGLYIQPDHTNGIVKLFASGGTNKAFAFLNGNTEAMRITSSGNVLIGTTTDTGGVRFQVASSASTWIGATISGNGGTDKVVMGNYTNCASIGGHNSALNAWANLAINFGGGNVLIGTSTSGASKLRIVGLPTSAVGLSSGDVYNLSGVLMIA